MLATIINSQPALDTRARKREAVAGEMILKIEKNCSDSAAIMHEMKTLLLSIRRAALFIALLVLNSQLSTSLAQGTAFTYQGRLNSGGGAANGTYDFRFAIYDAGSAGNLIAGPLTNSPTGVSNGLFTVVLDFGAAVFAGQSRWLEIGVRTNSGTPAAFTTLGQRQPLTPSPYAIFANTASNLSGTISSANLSGSYGSPVTFSNGANTFDGTFTGQFFGSTFTGGTFTGNFIGTGSGLMDVWHIGGNFGTTPGVNFLGTTDNQPLEIAVNARRAMRFEPTGDSPNIIGGSPNNAVAPGTQGAVIAGGGQTANPNTVLSDFGTIGGGSANFIDANSAYSVVAGGSGNALRTNTSASFIGGGNGNIIDVDSYFAALAGGQANMIGTNTPWAFIGAGFGNVISNRQTSLSQGGFIGGGAYNALYGHWGAIGAGWGNTIESNVNMAFIGGGFGNYVGTGYSFLGGGNGNAEQPFAQFSVLGGGQTNVILSGADHSFLGGGGANTNAGQYSSIPGGNLNFAGGQYSFAAGHQAKAMNAGTFVWADSTAADFSSTASNQFLVRASGGVGINTTNPASTLDVNGSVNVSSNASIAGALKLGSGTGTDYGPSYPLVIRRVNSLSPTSSNIVARTDTCFIQRDGSNGGLRFGWTASPGNIMCSATAVTGTGAVIGFYNFQPGPAAAGSVQIFTDAQNVESVRISFGNPYSNIQMTELNISRFSTDYYWVGTLASSYNQ